MWWAVFNAVSFQIYCVKCYANRWQIRVMAWLRHRYTGHAEGLWRDRRPPCSCLFTALQVASKDGPWHSYRRYALFRTEGRLAYVRSWLCATVAVNSVYTPWATHVWDVRLFAILSDFMSLHDRETSLALAYEVHY